MSGKTPLVWVVASQETTERWSAALAAIPVEVRALPWSHVQPAADPEAAADLLREGRYPLAIFTSAYALEALPAGIGTGLSCACVGTHTADAARKQGFQVVVVGTRGATALAETLCEDWRDATPFLIVRGRDAREEAALTLRARGAPFDEVVAYAVEPRPDLRARLASPRAPSIVVLGSPRAVEALAAAWEAPTQQTHFVVPGQTTGAAAERIWPGRVHVAERPESDAIVRAVEETLARERKPRA